MTRMMTLLLLLLLVVLLLGEHCALAKKKVNITHSLTHTLT